jgi:glycosyltransferase involved in cell wall biosynthesis
MNLPKVSCYCATFGRPWALEEALESFLRQDYAGDKELVIVNDYDGHTLHFDHPEVRVINFPTHIIPLGLKFNTTVSYCSGDIFMPWEDDDIYLPTRISFTVEHMNNGFFHTNKGFIERGNRLDVSGNHFHCNMAMSRELWEKTQGYALSDKCDLDIQFLARMRELSGHGSQDIDNEDIFYVYRWGGSGSYHTSGWGSSDGIHASTLAEGIVESQRKQGVVVQGDYTLSPRWKYDYSEARDEAMRRE